MPSLSEVSGDATAAQLYAVSFTGSDLTARNAGALTLSPWHHLTQLNLSRCHLQSVPIALETCGLLRVLNLAHNELRILPDFINADHMPLLSVLDVSFNQLQYLSSTALGQLPMLDVLYCHGNPGLPLHQRAHIEAELAPSDDDVKTSGDVVQHSSPNAALLRYLRECALEPEVPVSLLKLNVVGPAGAGKTSLLRSLTAQQPQQSWLGRTIQAISPRSRAEPLATSLPMVGTYDHRSADGRQYQMLFTDMPGMCSRCRCSSTARCVY